MKRLTVAIVVGVIIPLWAQAQDHRVVKISPHWANTSAEVAIAINPTNPNNIIAVGLQLGTKGQPSVVSNYVYVTLDRGRNWRTIPAHNPQGRLQADSAIAFDLEGRAYHTYIAYDGIGQAQPEIARNGVFVQVSDDHGLNWSEPIVIVDHLNTVEPFEDKSWLVADRSPESPNQGNLYVGWSRFDAYQSSLAGDSTQIFFARSTDHGVTFEVPFRISDQGGSAIDGDEALIGAMPAVGLDGTVYMVWNGPHGLTLDRSVDGGVSFGGDRRIRDTPGGWDLQIDGLWRTNGLPVIDVDYSEGPHRGSLYINWVDATHGDHDVFVIHSRDQGMTWSSPVRVNDDTVDNGKDQFLTWLSVDPIDGSINVLFYDRRSSEDRKTSVMLGRSVDGGLSFINYRINQPAFVPNEGFFGDYGGIDAYGGQVAAIYMHGGKEEKQEVSVALFAFEPGSQRQLSR